MGKSSIVGFFACTMLYMALLAPAYSSTQNSLHATVSVEVHFDPRIAQIAEIEIRCSSGSLQEQVFQIESGGKRQLELQQFLSERTSCQLRALLPFGYHAEYVAKSKGITRNNDNGCQFAKILDKDSLSCRIELEQDAVRLTAYKKWIGGSGEEDDVRIRLECESGEFEGDRFINENSPAGWEITNFDPNGVVCSVFEEPGETYIPDEFDCQGLVIFPGKGEDCTMLNTKIVKRIEMLNRYGKGIMILVMLVAGLIAVKRTV